MAFEHRLTPPSHVLDALGQVVDDLQRGDPLAGVTVLVPNNASGVMARRALGRSGVAGIDVSTIPRFAEVVGGLGEAERHRVPVSPPLLDLAIEQALRATPGYFGSAATHASTIRAVRTAYRELRMAGDTGRERLAASSPRAAALVRLCITVEQQLATGWYDEADLLRAAIDRLHQGPAPAPIVVYLPDRLSTLAVQLLRVASAATSVATITAVVGNERADAAGRDNLERLGGPSSTAAPRAVGGRSHHPLTSPPDVISTTDADDECRWAMRRIIDAARSGTPFERMALVWPTVTPYARLVEHHLTAADIPWNGRSGTPLAERLYPRVLLELLGLDPHALRRSDVFALLADASIRTADGDLVAEADWLRVARLAGATGPDDWSSKLSPYRDDERWGESARSLLAFLDELGDVLADPPTPRWSDWSQWCRNGLHRLLGPPSSPAVPEPEFRAWEQLDRVLRRLDTLDALGDAASRRRVRAALLAELDATTPRRGRVGDGVTVSSLAAANGLDVDLVIVLGAADSTLPPTPPNDPLLDDIDRQHAGLPTSRDRLDALLHRFRCLIDSSAAIVTVPRGDLRTTAELSPSPWIAPWTPSVIASHTAGLLHTEFPASPSEFRLRSRLHQLVSDRPLEDVVEPHEDRITRRGLDVLAARRSGRLTEFDGDLSAAGVPALTDGRPVSPTRLEAWAACPHAYFVRYLLGVKPVDEPGADISVAPLDRGALVHATLDRFHRAVIGGDLAQPNVDGWSEEHRSALLALFDDECETLEQRGRAGRPASWSDHRDRLRADLERWLSADGEVAAARGARVIASERRFHGDAAVELSGGRRLALQGSIDRLDELADGTLVVTDHKTGSDRALSAIGDDDPTLGATVFQLAAYATVAARGEHDGHDEVRAEYSFFDKGRYKRHGVRFDREVWDRAGESIAAVVDGIESGWFPSRPERPGWRLYVACEYCEPDHLGTEQRYAEWVRKRHDPRVARWFGDV